MEPLHQRLAALVNDWRAADYPCDEFPAIAEILEWSRLGESGELRFLRKPQLRALETYWYLRLIAATPRVPELYERLYPKTTERLAALGLEHRDLHAIVVDSSVERLLDRIRTDDDFVRDFRLQAIRETLTLEYPSYILALAMGAGKTILVGAIIASEFAMAAEYPDGAFVQNALVFAPGKTIVESLRELTVVPYDRILPPRFYGPFAASLKLTFTRDGEKDIPVIDGSLFNVVVTNTEKIRIQKEQIRRSDIGTLLSSEREEDARAEIANLRLQKIASLPHLGVFSDEAHHTYGQALDTELKKVRKTVDYLHASTNVVCVVNTTGTPYFQRQPLRDVVVWYGLSEGIRDRILKDVAGNIQGLEFGGESGALVTHIVRDFLSDYGSVRLPDGSPAKLAMYFPQTDDVAELRPAVEAALAQAGLGADVVLVNTSDDRQTSAKDVDAFNRLNDPSSPHRLILLVNKGTEGWNCPSLFACALVRRLRTSNNFVLQAATRCLRQVPGNDQPARIYLSSDNFTILDRQLRETYGESIEALQHTGAESRRERIVVRKRAVPPLVLNREVTRVVRKELPGTAMHLSRPANVSSDVLQKSVYTIAEQEATRRVLVQVGDVLELAALIASIDTRTAAVELASSYRVDAGALHTQLQCLYPDGEIPQAHLPDLERQVEVQISGYESVSERVEETLALVKERGFAKEREDGKDVYVTEIVYPKARERFIVREESYAARSRWGFGFHYSPYDFDSNPEKHFFEQVLKAIDLHPADVEDVYFTGGLTDPAKTDFFVEYRDAKGKWRRYTPDFVIRKRAPHGQPAGSGRVYIVEIKAERYRDDEVEGADGRKARQVRRWEAANRDRLQYEIIFVTSDFVQASSLRGVMKFAEDPEPFLPIHLDRSRIADFCRKWKIDQMWLFGSILTGRFGPDSDVDFLVRFAPDERWSLFDIMEAEVELKDIVGREVDLVERDAIENSENWIRRRAILGTAHPFYAAG